MELVRLMLAVTLPWLLGVVWLSPCWPGASAGRGPALLGYGYVTGMLATTLVLRGLNFVGVALGFGSTIVVLILLIAIGGWRSWRLTPNEPSPRTGSGSRMEGAAFTVLLGLLAIRLASLGVLAIARPLFGWDAWATWAPKARVFYELRRVAPFVDWGEWLVMKSHGAYTISAAHYPPAVPLLETWVALALGRWDDSTIGVPWIGCAAALSLAFYGQARLWGASRLVALGFTYLLASLPILDTQVAIPGSADLWMAAVYGLACLSFFHWLRTGERRHGLVALGMALACPLIKVPGLVWMLSFLPALLAARMSKATLIRLAGIAIGAGGLLAAGFGLGMLDGSTTAIDLPYLGRYPLAFHPEVFAAIAESLFSLASWHLLFYVLCGIAILRWRCFVTHRVFAAMGVLALSGLGFVACVYLLTPLAQFAVDFTQFNRAMLHMVPALLFIAMAAWLQPELPPLRLRLHNAGRMARQAALALLALLFPAPLPAQETSVPAVVVGAVENVYLRPDETAPVDNQAVLGDAVAVLETTAGFARVRTASGALGWIPERAIRRGSYPEPAQTAFVRSGLAHVYTGPSFTAARPLLTAPLGARLGVARTFASGGHEWLEVVLPDGRRGFVAERDVQVVEPEAERPLKGPSDWIALGLRFLGAPCTWGGTTPLGFDCSGLVWRILEQHGVVLMRNSSEMCFREPKLLPVSFESLTPGDLLFFGSEDRIDHMGLWLGGGKLLQATAYGVPSTQVTEFAMSERLKSRFRYARRLAGQPGARTPGPLPPPALAGLEKALRALAAEGGAAYGIYFKDLAGGGTIALAADKPMHAASTMKTPVLLEVLRRVDAGTLRLADELPVRNEFKSVVDGSPFSIGLEPESDGPTMALLGKQASLEFLAREMIVRSSNLATNIVLSHVGPEAVQRFTDELGASTVKVRRCVEDAKAYEKGLNNETDASGMGIVLEAAVRSPKLSAAARAKAWEILAAQVFNTQIPAGIPSQAGVVVAHKTGSISSVQHDTGIVRLPDGREYVLVLLANDFGANDAGRQRVIEQTRKMSRAVWEAMIAPY